jgi:hypothetical protein
MIYDELFIQKMQFHSHVKSAEGKYLRRKPEGLVMGFFGGSHCASLGFVLFKPEKWNISYVQIFPFI